MAKKELGQVKATNPGGVAMMETERRVTVMKTPRRLSPRLKVLHSKKWTRVWH